MNNYNFTLIENKKSGVGRPRQAPNSHKANTTTTTQQQTRRLLIEHEYCR
jgi:hypothetical protein